MSQSKSQSTSDSGTGTIQSILNQPTASASGSATVCPNGDCNSTINVDIPAGSRSLNVKDTINYTIAGGKYTCTDCQKSPGIFRRIKAFFS